VVDVVLVVVVVSATLVKRPPRNTKDFEVFSKCLKIAKKWCCG
jgi:hypothetical protein